MSFFWETLAIVMMLQVLPLALLDLLACAAIVLQQKIRSILFYFLPLPFENFHIQMFVISMIWVAEAKAVG